MATFMELLHAHAAEYRADLYKQYESLSSAWDKRDLTQKIEAIQTNIPLIEEVLKFCQSATVTIGKPKVLRVWKDSFIEHKNRYVKLDIKLTSTFKGSDSSNYYVASRQSTGKTKRYFCKESFVCDMKDYSLPRLYINEYWHHSIPLTGELVTAFIVEAGENWAKVVDTVLAHMKYVEDNVDKIVSEHVNPRSAVEKRAFQEKLFKLFQKSKSSGFEDIDPKALLGAFQIEPASLELIAGFIKRNKADIPNIEEDDIITAQNLFKAKSVMES